MVNTLEVLKAGGLSNSEALIGAALNVGIPLHIAAAFAQKESNGRNVYGNDVGGTYSTPGAPDIAVTEANYAKFYDLVVNQGQKSNGVGPMQITYRGYLPQAKAQGIKLWVPFDNFVFGFRIIAKQLAGNYSTASIQRAGTLYNKGNLNSGITAYGYDVAKKADIWKSKLAVVPVFENLKRGSTGEPVKVLQAGLNRRFPSYSRLTVDGSFGPGTETVVKEFQRRVFILDDGIVGPATRAKLATFGIIL